MIIVFISLNLNVNKNYYPQLSSTYSKILPRQKSHIVLIYKGFLNNAFYPEDNLHYFTNVLHYFGDILKYMWNILN